MDVQWTEETKVTAVKSLHWLTIQLDAQFITANIASTLKMDGDGEKELPPTDERSAFADCTPEVQKAIEILLEAFSAQMQAEAVKNPTLEVGMVSAAQG